MNRSLLTIAGCTAAILTATTHAQIAIGGSTSPLIGTEPSGVAFGDFNNDGIMDVASTVDDPDRIQVLNGDGVGGFALGGQAFLGASSSPQDLAAGDFNNDGLLDLAVAVRDPSGAVLIMLNNGAGSFLLGQSISVGVRPRGLDVADFDNDGDMDIAVANRESNNAHVLTNNAGSFAAQGLAAGAEPRKTTFGDFDADGDLDLAVTNHDARTVSIYTNTGGSFAATQTVVMPGIVRPEGIDAFDLDGDGDDDLAIANSSQAGPNWLSIYLSQGGTFGAGVNYVTGGLETGQIILADFDCDGEMDAALSNKTSSNVSILPGTGMGTFGAATLHAAGAGPDELAVGDFDDDGAIDLAVANSDGSTLTIFTNTSDCDGGGGGVDPVCPEDVNNDGVIGFEDLLAVLTAWGPCDG